MKSERLGSVICRFHTDEDPSMSIYLNEKGNKSWYTYYCFGCQATGLIPKNEIQSWMSDVVRVSSDKPRPQLNTYLEDSIPCAYDDGRYSTWETDTIKDFFTQRNIWIEAVCAMEIMYNKEKDALVWRCFDEHDRTKSGQVRFLDPDAKPKIIHVDAQVDPTPHFPRYAMMQEGESGMPLVVAESYLDALSLVCCDNNTCATMSVLSTNFNKNTVSVLHHLAQKYSNGTIILCFDADESGLRSERLWSRYLTPLGYRVIMMANRMETPVNKITFKPYMQCYKDKVMEVLRGIE